MPANSAIDLVLETHHREPRHFNGIGDLDVHNTLDRYNHTPRPGSVWRVSGDFKVDAADSTAKVGQDYRR